MSIQSLFRKSVWPVIALALASCAPQQDPGVQPIQPASPTLLGETPLPTTVTEVPAVSLPDLSAEAEIDEPVTAVPGPTSLPAELLPDLGPAPEISNELWINTEQPLNLAALQGKVVLIEFWTFG